MPIGEEAWTGADDAMGMDVARAWLALRCEFG